MRNQLVATRNITQTQLKNEEPMTVAFSRTSAGSNNATIQALENKMRQLLVKYTENYPEVIRLKAEIEALKKESTKQQSTSTEGTENVSEPEMTTMNPVYQQLKETLFQTEAQIDATDAKKRQLSALIAQKEAELRYMPEGKKKLADLEKERDSYKQIYEQLLTRASQSEVSKQMEIGDKAMTFRIVDPAVLPTKPVSPNRVNLIFVGICLGFLGGLGGTMARENFDASIKHVEVLKSVGVDVLAVIPRIFNEQEDEKEKKKQKLLLVVAGSYLIIVGAVLVYEIINKYVL
jgi:succinoglycan biosynthesis transport protein ExoP